ncbi:hypothetical protein VTO73DRAFT_12129 [Trametes versicolor]
MEPAHQGKNFDNAVAREALTPAETERIWFPIMYVVLDERACETGMRISRSVNSVSMVPPVLVTTRSSSAAEIEGVGIRAAQTRPAAASSLSCVLLLLQ